MNEVSWPRQRRSRSLLSTLTLTSPPSDCRFADNAGEKVSQFIGVKMVRSVAHGTSRSVIEQ